MGIQSRREYEKQNMKRKIMDAAIQIINREGYEHLSIRKIAAVIEYSPTTIYLYYKDKAAIITDMGDEIRLRIENECTAILQKEAPAAEQLHDILLQFIMNLTAKPETSRAFIASGMNYLYAKENDTPYPTNAGLIQLDQLLEKGIRQKAFRPDTAGTSWMLVSALIGFVISVIENRLYRTADFGQVSERFVALLMGGIRND